MRHNIFLELALDTEERGCVVCNLPDFRNQTFLYPFGAYVSPTDFRRSERARINRAKSKEGLKEGEAERAGADMLLSLIVWG